MRASNKTESHKIVTSTSGLLFASSGGFPAVGRGLREGAYPMCRRAGSVRSLSVTGRVQSLPVSLMGLPVSCCPIHLQARRAGARTS